MEVERWWSDGGTAKHGGEMVAQCKAQRLPFGRITQENTKIMNGYMEWDPVEAEGDLNLNRQILEEWTATMQSHYRDRGAQHKSSDCD